MSRPLAYFITFTTYGTWLHGRNPGSVDRSHNSPGTPYLPADSDMERRFRASLRQPPYILDADRREIVLRTIREVVKHRRWRLWAAHVRSNHVHSVISAECSPEKLMIDLKAWASRRLREKLDESRDRTRWTEHGSTRWLNREPEFHAAIAYVLDEQGTPMARYDGRNDTNEHEAGRARRVSE